MMYSVFGPGMNTRTKAAVMNKESTDQSGIFFSFNFQKLPYDFHYASTAPARCEHHPEWRELRPAWGAFLTHMARGGRRLTKSWKITVSGVPRRRYWFGSSLSVHPSAIQRAINTGATNLSTILVS